MRTYLTTSKIKIKPEVVGLIDAEGYIGDRVFIFANSNQRIIKEIINFLSQFNLELKTYLEISTKNINKNFIKKAKKCWEKSLKIKIKRVRERKEFKNTTKAGTLHIGIYNKEFSKQLSKVINQSKKKIEKNKQLTTGYLKGIIAGEGNINVKGTTTKCLYMVRISAKEQSERNYYKKLLKNIGINVYCKDMPTISKEEGIKIGWKTTRGRAGAVLISRWENFIKILLLDLLELHEDKKKSFAKHFVNNKFTKNFLSFEPFIKKEFTTKEAQTKFQLRGRHIDRLLTLYKKGYVTRREIHKKKHVYKLTPKYIKTYNLFKRELPITKLIKSLF